MSSELNRNWRIVLGCSLGLSVSASPAYLSVFGLFLKGFSKEYGWTRGAASIGVIATSLVAALLTPFVGAVIDRFGARIMILAGCILFPLALIAFGLVPLNYDRFIACAVFAGIASSIVAPSTYLNLPAKYFEKSLGIAMSLAVLGLGIGQMIMPLIIAQFISQFGLAGAWIALGTMVALIGLLNLAALLWQDTTGQTKQLAGSESQHGDQFESIIRNPVYWGLTISFLLVIMMTAGVSLHLPAIMTDRGFTPAQSAAAISCIGLGSLLAIPATGMMLDRLPPSVSALVFFGGQIVGCLLIWAGVGGPGPFLAALLIGGSLGAEGGMMPFVLKKAFGIRSFGRAYGLCFGLFQLGVVAGSLLIGVAFDELKSYQAVLLGFCGLTALAIAIFILSARKITDRFPGIATGH